MPVSSSNFGISPTERLTQSPARWDRAQQRLASMLRVAIPGVVQSFDPVKQTVSVQPAITENINYLYADDSGWRTVKDTVPLPVLQDVPISLHRGGGFSATLPIQPGDECVVLFSDVCIDAWWQSGGTNNNQMELRRHDLSDGIAILGPWSQPRRLQNYSTNSAQLRSDDGTVVIDVAGSQITLTAPNVTVNASNTATISGNQVNINGSAGVTITGNNATKIEGRTFTSHEHVGVQTGGGVTGPVL